MAVVGRCMMYTTPKPSDPHAPGTALKEIHLLRPVATGKGGGAMS